MAHQNMQDVIDAAWEEILAKRAAAKEARSKVTFAERARMMALRERVAKDNAGLDRSNRQGMPLLAWITARGD